MAWPRSILVIAEAIAAAPFVPDPARALARAAKAAGSGSAERSRRGDGAAAGAPEDWAGAESGLATPVDRGGVDDEGLVEDGPGDEGGSLLEAAKCALDARGRGPRRPALVQDQARTNSVKLAARSFVCSRLISRPPRIQGCA